jgi:hypothetical protein
MFSEAYIIFSLGLTRPLQAVVHPECFVTHTACTADLTHVQNYIQIIGIAVGMSLASPSSVQLLLLLADHSLCIHPNTPA